MLFRLPLDTTQISILYFWAILKSVCGYIVLRYYFLCLRTGKLIYIFVPFVSSMTFHPYKANKGQLGSDGVIQPN